MTDNGDDISLITEPLMVVCFWPGGVEIRVPSDGPVRANDPTYTAPLHEIWHQLKEAHDHHAP